ncbi:intradiol ring-cleavage dioxygenase [Sandaracinus amylolyticus]|uniref:intradiol ring-cleavage dioxygenase n=1 Tax=Sandaracinus amylolyticus TaxID=927083 RepID=UPI001F3FE855|nr:intradiol ring-cleavage dioxygenase [Sandaracinus amylolyticus]UJR83248.1 Hypothetical protein I5071_53150 [Sandaracinus amylolyticus]
MHDHDDGSRGLRADVAHLMSRGITRRRAVGLLASAGLVPLVGCAARAAGGVLDAGAPSGDDAGSSDGGSTSADAGASDSGTTAIDECSAIPEETAGPYPGDGTNGPNALALSGIVRSDIRTSLGVATGVATGVPLTVTLTLVDAARGCVPLAGYAVYLWHCDRNGDYSMYSAAIASESYLRGVQESDDSGRLTFTTIVPGCYVGRWPHIHFEIHPSLTAATNGRNAIRVSQLAMPEDVCSAVYASAEGYGASASALRGVSLTSDNVFRDGWSSQLASVAGSVAGGYAASLVVGIVD